MSLFLAHLSRAPVIATVRQTASADQARAAAVALLPATKALSLYTGKPRHRARGRPMRPAARGIAEVPEGGEGLAREPLGEDIAAVGATCFSGAGRRGRGLLALGDELDDPPVPRRARRAYGHEMATATRRRPPLTGLAHGAAGTVLALVELFRRTADDQVQPGRCGAGRRLRASPIRRRDRQLARPARALGARRRRRRRGVRGRLVPRRARRRAVAAPAHAGLLGPRRRREIAAGAAYDRRWLARRRDPPGNLSLCHGLAGNAEILWERAYERRVGAREMRRLAIDVAELGWEEYGRPGRDWPCGTPGGETPSLMLGLAGIGLFYLRLEDPSLPSVLVPGARRHALSEMASP